MDFSLDRPTDTEAQHPKVDAAGMCSKYCRIACSGFRLPRSHPQISSADLLNNPERLRAPLVRNDRNRSTRSEGWSLRCLQALFRLQGLGFGYTSCERTLPYEKDLSTVVHPLGRCPSLACADA